MIDTDELRRLANTATPPPLDTVLRRGARLRQRRRLAAAASSGLAVTIAVGVGVTALVALADHPEPATELAAPIGTPLVAPADDVEDCSGFAEERTPEEADGLRYLPSWLPAGMTIDRAFARAELLTSETCPRVPVALAAADNLTDVARSVRVDGPSPVPYERYEGPTFEPIHVRGGAAELVTFEDQPDLLQIRWTERTGQSYLIESWGLPADELRHVTESLRLGATAEVGWLPDGMTTVHRRPPDDDPRPDEQRYWHAVVDDGSTLSLEVTEPVPNDPPTAALRPGDQVVEIRGHQAVARTSCPHDDCTSSLTWEEAPGIRVTLSAALDLDTVRRIAVSLEPATLTDPRIHSGD